MKKVSFLLLFVSIATSLIAQNEVSQREVIALLELKAKTKGHLWTQQWDQSKPISTWHGVTVKDGKVVALDLSDNNLQGKLPITIGNLRHLQVLDLSGNQIEGKIPALFRKFQDLKEVNLEDNKLAGNIPNTINKLQNLQELKLSNNQLQGSVPNNINTLKKLTTLALANNDLQGALPEGMEKLTKLKRLYLSNTKLTNLSALKGLASQQLILTDFEIDNGKLVPLDFSKVPEGLSKLKFEDFDDM